MFGKVLVRSADGNMHYVDYDAVVLLMDSEIREKVYGKVAPCTEQKFVDTYEIEHYKKYHKDFVVD